MQQKTNAIVLSSIKYADTSLITSCYTEESGIKSYLLKGVLKSKRGKIKKALFQPLTQIEIIANHNNKGHLNSIKEARLVYYYNTLHTDIIKQSLSLFLSEVLVSCLREEEANPSLYKYLETSLQWLDSNEKIANFHLVFLLQLTKYLGFYPEINENKAYFDMLEGMSVEKPINNLFIQEPQLSLFYTLLGTNFDALPKVVLTNVQRQELLDIIIQYIILHLQTFKKPKSVSVLQALFK